MKPKIINNFEQLLQKYSKVLSVKELVRFSEQIAKQGYSIAINEGRPRVEEPNGFFNTAKRESASRRGIDLNLSPAQRYMYS